MSENMGYLIKNLSLEELQSSIELLNYVTLVEKTRFAIYSQINGCIQCNQNIIQTLPKDMISSVSGDKEYPLEHKTSFFGYQVFETLREKNDYNQVVGIFGSYHLFGILSHIVRLTYENKGNPIPRLDRSTFSKALVNYITEQTKQDKYKLYEKIAIIETIHQSIESTAFGALNFKNETTDFKQYVDYVQQYGYSLSYERLAEKNPKIDSFRNTPGECIAESLVFGENEDENEDVNDDNDNDNDTEEIPEEKKKPLFLEDKLSKIEHLEKSINANTLKTVNKDKGKDIISPNKIKIKNDKPKKKKNK